ncbi:MAG: polysaccharide deacetylase family protein [Chloroflexota bacterium]
MAGQVAAMRGGWQIMVVAALAALALSFYASETAYAPLAPTPMVVPKTAPSRTPPPAPLTATRTNTAVPTAWRTPTARATSTPSTTPTRTATATRTPTPLPAAWMPIIRGKAETGVAALTFDAGGRDAGATAVVLDALQRHSVRATFFLTGEWSLANPDLVRRLVAAGHELANHTYDHPHLPATADQEILAQLARTEAVVREVAGVQLRRFVRPPFGEYDRRVLGLLGAQGYGVVQWTLDSGDWRAELSAAEVEERVATQTAPGYIVVMHCYAPKTGQVIESILTRLAARGVRLGTLSQALGR